MFVSHLAEEGLAHQTIKCYLSAVRNLHINFSAHDQFSSQLTPKLEMVLRRIKKELAKRSPSRIRLPITQNIMLKIKAIKRPKEARPYYALGSLLPGLLWFSSMW